MVGVVFGFLGLLGVFLGLGLGLGLLGGLSGLSLLGLGLPRLLMALGFELGLTGLFLALGFQLGLAGLFLLLSCLLCLARLFLPVSLQLRLASLFLALGFELGLTNLFLPLSLQLCLAGLLLALRFELCLTSLLLALSFKLGLAYLLLPGLFLHLRLPGRFLARGFLALRRDTFLLLARSVAACGFGQPGLFLTCCLLANGFLTRQLATLGLPAGGFARLLLGLALLIFAGGVELRLFFLCLLGLYLLFLRQASGFQAGSFYPRCIDARSFQPCGFDLFCRHPVCRSFILRGFFLGHASRILARQLVLLRLLLTLRFQPQIFLTGELLAFGFLLGSLLRLPLDAVSFLLQLFLPSHLALRGLLSLFRLFGLRYAKRLGPLAFSADDVWMCFVALRDLFRRLRLYRAISLAGRCRWRGNGLRGGLLGHGFHLGIVCRLFRCRLFCLHLLAMALTRLCRRCSWCGRQRWSRR